MSSSPQPSCSTSCTERFNINQQVPSNGTSSEEESIDHNRLSKQLAYQQYQQTYQNRSGSHEGSLGASSVLTSSNDATIIREIPAVGEGECSSISGVLRYCKRRVLYPYLKLLGIMGLKPLNADSSSDLCTFSLLMNKLYIVFVAFLLISGYILEYLTCFRRDWGFNYKSELSAEMAMANEMVDKSEIIHDHSHSNVFNDSLLVIEMDKVADYQTSTIGPDEELQHNNIHNICAGNLFYVHFLPSILHFVSFIYMLCLYWLNHDEQLQVLMERVFLQATQAYSNFFSQKKVLRTLKFLVIFGSAWIFIALSCVIFQVFYHRVNFNFWPLMGMLERRLLASLMTVSIFWQDAMQVTVIISYCIHCHLLSIYLDFINSRISQHSITLSECIKEIGEIDKLLRYINNELATGLLPILMLDVMVFTGGVSHILIHGSKLSIQDIIVVGIVCILWLCMVALPLVQAAKLSTALKKIRELGHLVRMRPFGYQNYEQADLDSFLLFVSTVKMDVRILKMPLTATNLSLFICFVTFSIFLWGYFQ